MKPAVITSRAASKDMEKIKTIHADLLVGLANHQVNVQGNKQQKSAEMAQKQTMDGEMKKAEMTANTANQKNALDFQSKQAELDIKRSALV